MSKYFIEAKRTKIASAASALCLVVASLAAIATATTAQSDPTYGCQASPKPAGQPNQTRSRPFVYDLKAPANQVLTGTGVTPILSPVVTTSNGWDTLLVKIDVAPPCTQVNIVVEYEGTPTGWTVNIGDTPTTDGYGGDAGSSPAGYDAELQVTSQVVTAYSNSAACLGPTCVSPLVSTHEGLTDGALKFVVRNQFASWGQPLTQIDSTNSFDQRLFAIPDASMGTVLKNSIWASFNRVVSGRPDRVGTGARRVMITMQ